MANDVESRWRGSALVTLELETLPCKAIKKGASRSFFFCYRLLKLGKFIDSGVDLKCLGLAVFLLTLNEVAYVDCSAEDEKQSRNGKQSGHF